jgi:hypothetical protein
MLYARFLASLSTQYAPCALCKQNISHGASQIWERLWGGDLADVQRLAKVNPNHIDTVLSLCTACVASKQCGMNYVHIPIKDDQLVPGGKFDAIITLIVYAIYEIFGPVLRLKVMHTSIPIKVTWNYASTGFTWVSSKSVSFEDARWPYRLILKISHHTQSGANCFQGSLKTGEEAGIVIVVRYDESDADTTLSTIDKSREWQDQEKHRRWNQHFTAVLLVAPRNAVRFEISKSGKYESISPKKLVQSKLWQWHNLLVDTRLSPYLPAVSATIADWNVLYKARDLNGDHLIDWTHIYKHKNSPFVDVNPPPANSRWLRVTAGSQIDWPCGQYYCFSRTARRAFVTRANDRPELFKMQKTISPP